MNARRHSPRAAFAGIAAVLLATTVFAGIRGAWKYSGVVIFDRWGACYLYSGVYLIEISESVKESLRAFQGKAVVIDAKEVFQPINPGDGLITKLQVLGPAEEPKSPAPFGRPPELRGLTLRVAPVFPAHGAKELIIILRNEGNAPRRIDAGALGPTLFTRRQGRESFDPGDGPSSVVITRTDLTSLYQAPAGPAWIAGPRKARLSLVPGLVISHRLTLQPGQSLEAPLNFELSPGEYEFMAGYGGGVHETRALASNRIDFDVDAKGEPHLTKEAEALNEARAPRRYGKVCGRVTLENGDPARQTTVYLWPSPFDKNQPRSASVAVADREGRFRMDSVLEGEYILSAVGRDQKTILVGAVGGLRAAYAAALALPDKSGSCSLSLTIHPQPLYALRGRTEPANASPGVRKAYLKMTSGDAFPYESTAVIRSDGRYEFRDVPAGTYQFFAGLIGAGFEVRHDIDDLGIEIKWPDRKEGKTARGGSR